jgi:hypothetical protein
VLLCNPSRASKQPSQSLDACSRTEEAKKKKKNQTQCVLSYNVFVTSKNKPTQAVPMRYENAAAAASDSAVIIIESKRER